MAKKRAADRGGSRRTAQRAAKESLGQVTIRTCGAGKARIVPGANRWEDAAKQAAFLEHLAATANVAASARAVGLEERGAYRLRQKSSGFRAAWAAALCEGYAQLELLLLERSIHGTEKPVFHAGAQIGVVREYPDATALRLLAVHRDAVAAERAAPTSDPAAVAAKIEALVADIAARLRITDAPA